MIQTYKSNEKSALTSVPADLYFIALLLPPSAARQVERYQVWARDTFDSQAALRSPPHVTLQSPFKLGDDDNKVLKSVLTVCAGQTPAIDVTLSGFGAFPPRVVYIDVVRTPELMTVQSALSRHLKVTFGIGCDLPVDRPFRPHVSVAFRDLKRSQFRKLWAEVRDKSFTEQFQVTGMALLRHDGRCWRVGSEYRFGS